MTTSTAATTSSPRPRSGAARKDWLVAYLFLIPFIAVYLAFLVYPLLSGFWISLHDWELVGDLREFIGFANYQDLWSDPLFWKTIRNTSLFALITVPSMTALALALALAVSKPGRLYAVLRGIFFASSVFSVSVVTLVWRMVLDGDRGLIANVLRSVGMQPVGFLGDPFWAMPSLAVATLWWGVGLPMALFIAALNQIPQDIYEAAELDFASRWKVLGRITLPSIKRTLVLVLVLQIVLQFQMFGQAQLMTKGGPADQTRTIVQYIYDTGFRDWQIGYASAMAIVLFVLMFSISMLQLWLGRKGD
jgi:multiple sugar transport system permease protein